MISLFFKKFGGWCVAIISLVFALFTTFRVAKSAGAANAREDAAKEKAKVEIAEVKESAKVEIETVKGANDVANTVNKLDSSAVTDKLRNEWARD